VSCCKLLHLHYIHDSLFKTEPSRTQLPAERSDTLQLPTSPYLDKSFKIMVHKSHFGSLWGWGGGAGG
jgi:hypothetical protein